MKTKLLLIPLVLFALACGDEKPVAPAPVACFTYTPETAIKAGDAITFTNCSENATAYSWDFGDGNTSTHENPTHAYDQEGTYSVTLTTIGDGGVNTSTKEIIIDAFAGYIFFNGEKYWVDKGYFQSRDSNNPYGNDDTGRFHDISLISNTIGWNKEDFYPETGSGFEVYFNITTNPNHAGNIEGDFTHKSNIENNDPSSAPDYSWFGILMYEYNISEDIELTVLDISSLTKFKISKTGSVYEINVEGQGIRHSSTGEETGTIEIYYEGALEN